MADRKIIQIIAVPETENVCGHLFALCDDGTVWAMPIDGQFIWTPAPALPKEKV